MSEGDYGASALSTPSRASDPDNNNSANNNYGNKGNNTQNTSNNSDNRQNTRPNNDTTQTDSNGGTGGAGGGGGGATEGGISTNNTKNGVNAGSCLAGPQNPKTVSRKNLSLTGNDVIVHFDERVVVHTVPYWDPCGETYYDDDTDGQDRGPNCCIIL